MIGLRPIFSATVIIASMVSVEASAEPLYSVWALEPLTPVGVVETSGGAPFLQQRLVPAKLVKLSEAADIKKGKSLSAGTYLFEVRQRDGKTAYCTIKDQSIGNVAKSAFIPMFDKRPCLVDANADGKFEAAFSVFDKFGSALTPSGNLSSSKPTLSGGSYEQVSPGEFPAMRKISYALISSGNPKEYRIAVRYDNGRGSSNMTNSSASAGPDSPRAVNVGIRVLDVVGNTTRIDISIDPDIYLVGDSGGSFTGMSLDEFAKGRK